LVLDYSPLVELVILFQQGLCAVVMDVPPGELGRVMAAAMVVVATVVLIKVAAVLAVILVMVVMAATELLVLQVAAGAVVGEVAALPEGLSVGLTKAYGGQAVVVAVVLAF
jgi:hypothetical protein